SIKILTFALVCKKVTYIDIDDDEQHVEEKILFQSIFHKLNHDEISVQGEINFTIPTDLPTSSQYIKDNEEIVWLISCNGKRRFLDIFCHDYRIYVMSQ
ncbi:MAG TPA: hypothetical protein PLD88_11530, partial [Candidatus Berkiella sp.]|nr:hypothetical protein [Candidatus Berkiella sp.]